MGRVLRYLGVAILAFTAWLLLADVAGWIPSDVPDRWVRRGIVSGLACLGAGIVMSMLSPVERGLRRGRCVRCGAKTERGQAYCRDHYQQALNEIRDDTREKMLVRPGRRGPGS